MTKKANRRRSGKRGRAKGGAPSRRRSKPAGPDPSDSANAEVRYLQPYQATKTYLCPGCNRDIPPGLGHMVVVPPEAPDLRRHWHRGCWVNRHQRY